MSRRYEICLQQIDTSKMGAKATKITYFDGSYYEGDVNERQRENGKGRISYANGDSLKGTFVDGDCTYAVITKKNGDSYQGHMKEHKYHGSGKLHTKKYDQVGLFRDNRFMHGRIKFSDGSSYEGSIENGVKSGRGTFIAKDGTCYEGYFKYDKLEGSGEVTYKDGTIYKGNLRDGAYHGKGHLKQFDEGRLALDYEGDFVDGIFDGYGKLRVVDTNDEYSGHFREGKKHGHGQFKYGDGDIYQGNYIDDVREDQNCKIHLASGATYQGGIMHNQFHGRGILTRSNGDYYQGQFENGKKRGRGILKINSAVYEGDFEDDMKHGKGKITYNNEDNQVYEGYFKNDKKDGKGISQGKNEYFEATFENGVKNGPYRKKIGTDYDEEGIYQNDVLNGRVKIRKGEFVAVYRYEDDEKMQEITE